MNDIETYEFYQHKECKFFPCHDVDNIENFNCKWCYCPLYFVKKCVGNYKMNDNGVKDCSDCKIPHYADMKELVGEKIKEYVRAGCWIEKC